ncbi:Tn7-like element transposition protein TnsE [Bacillus cereus group sp. N21]|uniref:Tn7-like element transposition protein TnsE n=1 Tax=Bacillus cereus group sp. N21 TaxID=2794591 RepID=UPI001F5B4D8A|nr:Tn7-like element transposition protein TnsE [Bacillus cereus group sp. N21]
MIYINQVFQYTADSQRIRIIEIEESYVYVVNIDTTSAMPKRELYSHLEIEPVTKRRYVIAQIYLGNGKQFNIIEIERENRSLSMLILSSLVTREWKTIYDRLLINLVNDSGTWTSKSLKSIEDQGITVVKAKHSSKGVQHRAEVLLNKLDY